MFSVLRNYLDTPRKQMYRVVAEFTRKDNGEVFYFTLAKRNYFLGLIPYWKKTTMISQTAEALVNLVQEIPNAVIV